MQTKSMFFKWDNMNRSQLNIMRNGVERYETDSWWTYDPRYGGNIPAEFCLCRTDCIFGTDYIVIDGAGDCNTFDAVQT